MTNIGTNEPNGWTRMGTLPGPRMWSLGFMRIERTTPKNGCAWRAWDVWRGGVPDMRDPYPTTFHRTLKAAKAHCEAIILWSTNASGLVPPGEPKQ